MKAACFTGHRIVGSDFNEERMRICIEKAISKGCDTFICGGALGFDTVAAKTVLEYKKRNPNIQLHLYLPCNNQADRWTMLQKTRYKKLIKSADYVDMTDRPYYDGCMRERNYKMVDKADICICYLNNTARSGTAQTVRYALKKGRIIVNVSTLGEELLDELRY